MSTLLWEPVPVEHPTHPFRIKALRNLRWAGALEGELGGFLADPSCMSRTSWADARSTINATAKISGGAIIRGSKISGEVVGGTLDNCIVDEDSTVVSSILNRTVVSISKITNSEVGGTVNRLFVKNTTIDVSALSMYGNLQSSTWNNVRAAAGWISLNDFEIQHGYEVLKNEHFMSVGPVGSENSSMSLIRTTENKPFVAIGCWSGSLEDVMGEVSYRMDSKWSHRTTDKHALWYRQYELVVDLFTEVAGSW